MPSMNVVEFSQDEVSFLFSSALMSELQITRRMDCNNIYHLPVMHLIV